MLSHTAGIFLSTFCGVTFLVPSITLCGRHKFHADWTEKSPELGGSKGCSLEEVELGPHVTDAGDSAMCPKVKARPSILIPTPGTEKGTVVLRT